MVGLLVLGAFSDFIPAPFLSGQRWLLPMWLLGAGLTALVIAPMDGRRSSASTRSIPFWRSVSRHRYWDFCAGWRWLEAGHGFTRALQAPILKKCMSCRPHTCALRGPVKYRLSGGPLEHRFPNHLCIDEDLYRRHPEQQVPMRLRGQLSVLGMRIAASAEDP
ncbi:hypothetical protein [Xanthomonas vasicola]|uniref:hypothetical protein n=1 Tax=Xanthomonas vasicola TaxID=56459 RepID=UPI00034B87F2|nr:hypothetical protein [Xanthomonas vasicola]